MNLLYAIFLYASTMPYVQLLPIGSYTQPYALVLALLIVVRKWHTIFRTMPAIDLLAVLSLFVLGTFLFLISSFPEVKPQELKYLLNFASPFFIAAATFVVASERPELAATVLRTSIAIWLATALVQTFVTPSFLSFLIGSWSDVAEHSVASGRGVVALAPEPTHHGFHMLLLAASAALLFDRPRFWPALAVADAVLLARSSSAVLAIAIGLMLWTLIKPYRLAVTIPVVAVVVGSGLAVALALFGEDSRLLTLADAFLREPQNILAVDASVNARLGGLIASFHYMIEHGFVPNGISHVRWLATSEEIIRRHDWLMFLSESGPPSGIGVILLQLGFVAFPIIAVIARRFLQTDLRGWASLVVLSAFAVFLGQYYIGAPGFGLVYGLAIHRAARRRSAPAAVPNASARAVAIAAG